MSVLIVPGWQDSEPEHWQSHWEKKLGAQRVVQREWMAPVRSEWLELLEKVVRAQATPPILVTHSLGGSAAAIVSAETDCKIRGIFMVCPPDLEMENMPKELLGFCPFPNESDGKFNVLNLCDNCGNDFRP